MTNKRVTWKPSKHTQAAGIVDYRKVPNDLQTFGTPNWVMLHGASSMGDNWTKTTTAMEVPGLGVLVRTATQTARGSSEALCMVAGATIEKDPKTALPVLVQSNLIERFSKGLGSLLDEHDKKKTRAKRAAKKAAPKKRKD